MEPIIYPNPIYRNPGSAPAGTTNNTKTCLKRPFKMKTKTDFQDPLSLNAGQKYCRMLQGEHSAKLSTFIKLPIVIKIFVLSIFEWPLKTGFTVQHFSYFHKNLDLLMRFRYESQMRINFLNMFAQQPSVVRYLIFCLSYIRKKNFLWLSHG